MQVHRLGTRLLTALTVLILLNSPGLKVRRQFQSFQFDFWRVESFSPTPAPFVFHIAALLHQAVDLPFSATTSAHKSQLSELPQ